MKSISLTILLSFLLVTCKKEKAEETTSINNRSIDIKQVVGIGKKNPKMKSYNFRQKLVA
jgi:hypothetical protein